jgi:hypothetical protein
VNGRGEKTAGAGSRWHRLPRPSRHATRGVSRSSSWCDATA